MVLNGFANLVRSTKLDKISQFVMAYGGLRGAIAFSLAVVLEERIFPSRQLFITTTIFVVYFTTIILVCNRRRSSLELLSCDTVVSLSLSLSLSYITIYVSFRLLA